MPAILGRHGDMGLIPGLGRFPGGRMATHSSNLCLENSFHGERSLARYSPCGLKELDAAEQLNVNDTNNTINILTHLFDDAVLVF